MKKILLIAALMFSVLTSQAVVLSTNISGANTNNVLAGTVQVYQLQIANTTAAVLSLTLFDAPSTSVQYTNAPYTLVSRSGPTNQITTYTNFFGVTESWTNLAIINVTNSYIGTTNLWPRTSFTVAANTTTTFTPSSAWMFSRGLLVTNNTNCTITIDYLAQ